MFEKINTILFATNLSPSCRAAFEAAIALSAKYQAELVLLHVIDRDVPMHVEEHLRAVLGPEKYAALAEEHQQDARQALIGKMSSESLLHTALRQYCEEAGLKELNSGLRAHQIVVAEGDVKTEVLSQADRYECDLIVIGARKGFLKNNSMGSVVKGVMRKAKIPVLFVPPRKEDEA
ncbi:universal stress protein [Desulfatitalea alkaliphila]|uniref:Universal stress protein n=1 Tax=Desulfatitalea alkaliphila TaxID=2929485 RepID=A0AA41R2B8_9BACT|nr:universal stress protein [Desulfatitalea alkaliphila]MCJ8500313.1 universal stress protein [Desulfatitalea alkaliphila]